jgi:hypothetical protein
LLPGAAFLIGFALLLRFGFFPIFVFGVLILVVLGVVVVSGDVPD